MGNTYVKWHFFAHERAAKRAARQRAIAEREEQQGTPEKAPPTTIQPLIQAVGEGEEEVEQQQQQQQWAAPRVVSRRKVSKSLSSDRDPAAPTQGDGLKRVCEGWLAVLSDEFLLRMLGFWYSSVAKDRYSRAWSVFQDHLYAGGALQSVFLTKQVESARLGSLHEDKMKSEHGIEPSFLLLKVARSLQLRLRKDELVGELSFEFSPLYPLPPSAGAKFNITELENASNNAANLLGVPLQSVRRWDLPRREAVSSGTGTVLVADLIRRYLRSIAGYFEGVSECMICYCVVHAGTNQLPKRPCPTCKHLFHNPCLSQWFITSGKTICPLCKQPF